MQEKSPLIYHTRQQPAVKGSRWVSTSLICACLLASCIIFASIPHKSERHLTCPAQHWLAPRDESSDLDRVYKSITQGQYRNASLSFLQKAVQIDTQVFDDSGSVQNDPRFQKFKAFGAYLEQAFPLLHDNLEMELVNTHARLYTWRGRNASLRPIVLMAHIDTVPLGNSTQWTHPPLSGFWDGLSVWGRGVGDDKSSLVAIMESVTLLLQAKYTPERTLLLSFGFDEELVRNDNEGASKLARRIEEIYGRDSIELILDEGGGGVQQIEDKYLILPAVSEKGYLDLKIELHMQGGHSSVPPMHTGIGIISELVTRLESADLAFIPHVVAQDPVLSMIDCISHVHPKLDPTLTKLAKGASDLKGLQKVADYFASKDPFYRALITNTQAIDLIRGGHKANVSRPTSGKCTGLMVQSPQALPEQTELVINYRIAHHSSVEAVVGRAQSVIRQVSQIFDLPASSFTLSVLNPLKPSPMSPTSNDVWQKFSGALRSFFGQDSLVIGSTMAGNTDTKEYWNLSRNIYRFIPHGKGDSVNIHAIDEHISLKSHSRLVQFYFHIIRTLNHA